MTSKSIVHIIGGGLAGSEAAMQCAQMGVPVVLHEMRPIRGTEAHLPNGFAELVCSNSFRSDDFEYNAVGLLHEEMRRGGSLILACGDANKVPAGGALAGDRIAFSESVTAAIDAEPLITLVANPHQTVDFQRKFLTFTSKQFEEMKRQIQVSLPKVLELRHKDATLYLEQLMIHLDIHRELDNNPTYFSAKNLARKVYRQLPEQMQTPIRRVVQERRRSRLERGKA